MIKFVLKYWLEILFTIISNYHLRDRNLSLKAKGLLSSC